MKLTKTDRCILSSYASMLDGLGDYLGDGYELVLHSLENVDKSVIKIINGHLSGRSEGAPVTDLALKMLQRLESSGDDHPYVTYFSKNKNGISLKSSTLAIRGENDRIIGLLCMNFYMNTSVFDWIENFVPHQTKQNEVETFAENADGLLDESLAAIKKTVYSSMSIPNSQKNKEIIFQLYRAGVFELKGSVEYVAKNLGVSKNTVYTHIRELHRREQELSVSEKE